MRTRNICLSSKDFNFVVKSFTQLKGPSHIDIPGMWNGTTAPVNTRNSQLGCELYTQRIKTHMHAGPPDANGQWNHSGTPLVYYIHVKPQASAPWAELRHDPSHSSFPFPVFLTWRGECVEHDSCPPRWRACTVSRADITWNWDMVSWRE